MSLTSDPTSNVLIDWWLERGATVAEWTDEEAEHCRLAAFWSMLRDQSKGPWSQASNVLRCDDGGGGGRTWVWTWRSSFGDGQGVTKERRFSAFDLPDWALCVYGDEACRALRDGRKLPAKFRLKGKQYARVVAGVGP